MSVYEPWKEKCRQIEHLLETGDIKNFINWEPVRSTMFAPESHVTHAQFEILKKSKWWDSRWRASILETAFGNAPRYSRCNQTSANLIQQAYQVKIFEDITGIQIKDCFSILEFGGGFGSFARLCRKLDFNGKYQIYDLPTQGKLQKAYLSATMFPEKIPSLCHVTSDILPAKTLVSMFALAEVPIELREDILSRDFDMVYISYCPKYRNIVDNDEYFDNLMKDRKEYEWTKVIHSHVNKDARYLVGERK